MPTAKPRVMGLETEYGVLFLGRNPSPDDRRRAVWRLVEACRRGVPSLDDAHSSGVYLANGGRLYVDTGNHPELCTPEVTSPWDAYRYVRAGDRLLCELLDGLGPPEPMTLTRCGISYGSRPPSTWGSHENYLHQAESTALRQALIPHLVSRVIYTGCGGFAPTADRRFTLSPRTWFISTVDSHSSTSDRGILHRKGESLARGRWKRLHILCNESNGTATSTLLKLGVTALLVLLVENNLLPAKAVPKLSHPVASLRAFADDPGCTARSSGWTAIEIQRRYVLHCLEAGLDDPVMPDWAPRVCDLLRTTLDGIEQLDPPSRALNLDWRVKLRVFREHVRRRGFSWEQLSRWWEALARLAPQTRRQTPRDFRTRLARDKSRLAESAIGPLGLDPAQLEAVLDLQDELCVLDELFLEVRPEGIFHRLEAAGTIDGQDPAFADDGVDDAVRNPPADTRAALRGRAIGERADRRDWYIADWRFVAERDSGRLLDLGDPLAQSARWKEPADGWDPIMAHLEMRVGAERLPDWLDEAERFYELGDYRSGLVRLEALFHWRHRLPPAQRTKAIRLAAIMESRLGQPGGLTRLEPLMADEPSFSLRLITDCLLVLRFGGGLRPDPRAAQFIDRGNDVAGRLRRSHPDLAAFREQQGHFLLAEGQLEPARDLLEQVTAARTPTNGRMIARAKTSLAEAYRRLGMVRQARTTLEQAHHEQRQGRWTGELAEFTLPGLAKLQPDVGAAQPYLDQLSEILAEIQNPFAEARLLLVDARLSPSRARRRAMKSRLRTLRRTVPALRACRVLERILRGWRRWTCGELQPDESGDLWWGV